MTFLALKGMIRRIHPDAGDILPSMSSNSSDPSDKQEAIENLMAYLHPGTENLYMNEAQRSLGDQFLKSWSKIYDLTPDSDDGLEYLDRESEGTLFAEFWEKVVSGEFENIEDITDNASDKQLQQMISELKNIYNNGMNDLEGASAARRIARFKPKKDIEEADPYGGSMISPYGDEPSDQDMDKAYAEADYYINTENIDGDNPDEITNLKHETKRYLEQIGLGDTLSDENIEEIVLKYYPASKLDNLKTDLAKDPALKARFSNDPKDVINKYQKRDS